MVEPTGRFVPGFIKRPAPRCRRPHNASYEAHCSSTALTSGPMSGRHRLRLQPQYTLNPRRG